MSINEEDALQPIITGRIDPRLKTRQQAIETNVAAADPFRAAFGDLLGGAPSAAAPADEGVSAGDYAQTVRGGVESMSGAIYGAAEYGANQLFPQDQENPIRDFLTERRQKVQGLARDSFATLSPEAQNRLSREILTLDPNKTLFQGGPGEFVSSIGLKIAQSAPSTLVSLLPAGLMLRAGLTAGAVTYLGASEGGLSLGSIAANIAEEIEQAPEQELLQSEFYKQLRDAGTDEPQARQRLIAEAQGVAPLVGGVVVGAISAVAGRYLAPIFTDVGAGVGSRIARGAASEAGQEFGQSGAEQIAQNVAAQIYDTDRSALEGAGEAATQGAMIGGIMGGGFGVAGGSKRTGVPLNEEQEPAPAPASFEEVFGERAQVEGVANNMVGPQESAYRGADIENRTPEATTGGQALLDVGPVDRDAQAALNARRDGKITDMFDQQAAADSARAEQQGYLERPFPVTQMGMDLPQQNMDVGLPAGGQQLDLGLQERQRGGPVPITPRQAPILEEEPVPGEISMAQPAPTEPLGRRPTRGDFIKARAAQQRAQMTAGMVRDENQLDMFAAAPAEADAPSAEPLGDLQAQLQDLADPDNSRQAVLLSAANIEQLRADGTFEQVRGVGTPIANFDGEGGTLIAKNNKVAKVLLGARAQGANMQEIIGRATGSGTGKPTGSEIVVQQRDEQGNVTRESLVPSPEEAEQVRAAFEEPGRTGVILNAVEAIRRRNQRIREDRRQAQASKETKTVRRRAQDIIEEELGDGDASYKASKKIGLRPLSDNEAARKLTNYAARLRARELKGRVGDMDAPANLEFADLPAAQQYKQLFGEYRDAEIAVRLATNAENTNQARAKAEGLRRQLGAIRRTSKASTPSEKVARAARRISKEETDKIAREPVAPRRRPAASEGDILSGATRTALERATPEQLGAMSDSEVNLLFVEAANIMSGLRTSVSTQSAAAGETTVVSASGRSMDELLATYTTRSEQIKLIERAKRYMARQGQGGKTKTRPITATANTRKSGTGESEAVRRGKFEPTKALDLNPPREMSKADQRKYDARAKKALKQLETITAKLITIDNSAQGFGLEVQRDSAGNPTEAARDAVYGRTYLRTLIKYGKLLAQLKPRSRSGLNEIERFTKIATELAATPKEKLPAKLAQLTEAEIGEQVRAAVRVDPRNLGSLSTRKRRQATALLQNAKIREKVAAARRLHEQWKSNPKYEQFVAPLMQKLVGYVTYDTSLANITMERRGLGYVPTFSEMRNLRYALRDFKADNREGLYKPLKRWFQEYGFKFDTDGDLVLAKNAAQFEYVNETQLLQKARDANRARSPGTAQTGPAFRNPELNYNQKVTQEKLRKKQALINKERARRAALSAKQRAREDRSLADKIEKDRRKGMSYQQRRALESLDLRSTQFRMAAIDLTADMPGLRAAAAGLADALETSGRVPSKLTDALTAVGSKLAPDHPYQTVLQRLMNSGLDGVAVRWARSLPDGYLGGFDTKSLTLPDGTVVTDRLIRLNRNRFEELRAAGVDPAPAFVHTFIHEAVHAATVGAIYNNPAVRFGLMQLMRRLESEARTQGVSLLDKNGSEFYGLQDANPAEFVAEAFSNTEFQQRLREIKIDRNETLWQKFLRVVRQVLGLADTPMEQSVLDIVMFNAEVLFTGEVDTTNAGTEQTLAMRDDTVRGPISNVIDKILQSNRVTRDVRASATNTIERNKEGGTRLLLSALTMEQIRDFYSDSFGGNTGGLGEYMKAFFRRNADNSANMELPDKLSRRWTRLGEENPEAALEVSKLMTQATLKGIAPDAPLSAPVNSGAKSQVALYQQMAKQYRGLPAEFKQLYQDVQKYYDESLRREVALMTLNALRGVLGPTDFRLTEADIERKKLNTLEGLEQEFGDRLTDSERKIIYRMASLPQQKNGPYFPLMRFGDYVVTAERVTTSRSFIDAKQARAWAQEQRDSDPTLSVASPEQTPNGWRVTVKEKEVRMAESLSEAEADRQELIQLYGAENVDRQVQKKSDLFSRDAAINSNSGLRTILGKLDGNPAAQAAIKDFYLRSLADGSFRKREIQRANRRGVDPSSQQRTFRNYARSSAYYTAQLRFGWQLADALAGMNTFARDVGKGTKSSEVSSVRLSEVVSEIAARDKMTTSPYEMSKVAQKATELTQFMLLASPSYSMINATQPYMITLPWMAARTSLGDATAALLHAQRLIAAPVVNQAVSSAGGLRALWSRSAAEKAFSVLEQVEEYIKQRGGSRATEYINLLNKLKRESIIDFTLISELRDTAQGADTSLTARVMDASRIMGHLTEVNNRIVTALAAYDLYRNKGFKIIEAEGFAQQAVSLTQFNYSSGNSPRLFNARGPLGNLGPLVFQFMKYPQHIYALLIDQFRTAVSGGYMQKRVAIKTLAGLFTTHLAAAGLVGAMLQPIKWAIGLFLAAFGDDDEPYTVANALSGNTFDRLVRKGAAEMFGTDVGEVLSQGLPRAAGIDLSNRLSLGSLYFVDLRTDTTQETFGSLLTSFGGPALSVVGSAMRGAQLMREGQLAKGLEQFMPKGAKDALQAIRFSQQGLTDASGKEILGAEQMTPWDLFLKAGGFQPGKVSEGFARRSAIKDAQGYDGNRRKVLLRKIQRATPDERAGILSEIDRFNAANPGAYINRSQIIQSVQRFKEGSIRSSMLGADLRDDDVLYAEEGEPYEDDSDE